MPTLRTVTVKSAAGDYSSGNAALVGEVGDLVSLDRTLDIDCYAFVDTTAVAVGAGWTTDATRYFTFAAVDNHHGFLGGVGGNSSYLISPSSPAAAVTSVVPYAVYRGVSILSAQTGFDVSSGTSQRLERCIVKTIGSGWFGFALTGPNVHAENCLAIEAQSNAAGFHTFGSSVSLDNCSAYGYGLGFGSTGGGATTAARNCAAVGCFTGFDSADVWTGSANCCSTDATSPTSGSGHRTNQTVTLIDPSNGDYRLDTADAGAKGFGTDLSADANYPFSIDITGAARVAPWDIGAFNAVSIPHRGRFARRAAFGMLPL